MQMDLCVFGEALRLAMPLEPLSFQIALALEHLRRAEDFPDPIGTVSS